eukprot:TRINITY_DN5474_c0_g1_i4.p1 TRINITY_DN5474_c0_g1~~TRINITY_DN5474_c0_g1_i4.p1  ORF type:complete len:137 (+),score=17.54 TRINITY_DN5474_c0_g1_i4:499-909(+)
MMKNITHRRIDVQILRNGTEPLELVRTKSFFYSWFNVNALVDLADLARFCDVDIWGYKGQEGQALRSAIDFLLPYAIGVEAWPLEQIEPFDRGLFFSTFRRASIAYEDPMYEKVIPLLPNVDILTSRNNLMFPKIF